MSYKLILTRGIFMKALFYYDQRDVRLEQIEIPEPNENQVLLKVLDVGLCQTQINEFIEGPFIINKDKHKITGKAIPLIVGHEFGGIIEKIGKNIKDDSLIGKQVAVLPMLSCGVCEYCKRGLENVCVDLAYYGLLGENGGLAEYVCINKDNILPVMNRDILTFIEPILVAINVSQKLGQSLESKKILILGAGAIGLSIAAVFRDCFNADITVNDILPNRLQRAKTAGFDIKNKDELKKQYDIVIDAAGSNPMSKSSAFVEGFEYLHRGGTFISIGTYFHPVSIVPILLTANEYQIVSSFSYNLENVKKLPEILESLKTDFSIFIDRIDLDNIIEEGYYRSEVDKDSFTRLVITI